MRLYLSADTSVKNSYAPDVITITYTTEDDKKEQLSMDISGWVDYTKNTLDVRVKGELTPLTFIDDNEQETDLVSLKEKESQFFINRFNKYLPLADDIMVTLYAEDDLEEPEFFSNCEGEYHYVDQNNQTQIIEFTFKAELL